MADERAARDDFLAAAKHLRTLMALIDELDELNECGWLFEEQAAQVSLIREFLASDQQDLATALGHINFLLDIIRGVEGDECKKLGLRQGEDIVQAMDFVRAHARPHPADESPYAIVGFTSVEEFIAYLRDKQEQPDDDGSVYGDEGEERIVP